jgi:hypothetical protein
MGDSRLLQRAIEQLPGRPHEWMPGEIFRIARLLTHQHHFRPWRPLAEDSLRSPLIEVARLAAGGDPANHLERRPVRQEVGDGLAGPGHV